MSYAVISSRQDMMGVDALHNRHWKIFDVKNMVRKNCQPKSLFSIVLNIKVEAQLFMPLFEEILKSLSAILIMKG